MWVVSPGYEAQLTIRHRPIPLYLALAVLTIAAGLATRLYPAFFPPFIARYAGDALWAAMAFWILALGWRRAGTLGLTAGAIALAFAVELSQLYHAPWINSIRSTRIGALLLGSDFLRSDLVCYMVGAGLAAGIDALIVRSRAPSVTVAREVPPDP